VRAPSLTFKTNNSSNVGDPKSVYQICGGQNIFKTLTLFFFPFNILFIKCKRIRKKITIMVKE